MSWASEVLEDRWSWFGELMRREGLVIQRRRYDDPHLGSYIVRVLTDQLMMDTEEVVSCALLHWTAARGCRTGVMDPVLHKNSVVIGYE